MTNGFEEARGQRNFLERLIDKIPGFRGFQDRELRREVDKLQREAIAERLEAHKRTVLDKARSFTDAGEIGALKPFTRIDRRLDGLSQKIRFADYGASGFFDTVKIGEAELDKIYEFDLALLAEVDRIGELAAAVPEAGAEDPTPALDELADQIDAVSATWERRETMISAVVE